MPIQMHPSLLNQETPESSVRNIAMMLGMIDAMPQRVLTAEQRQCIVDSLWVLCQAKCRVDESVLYESLGLEPV